ncbi:MAG: Fe-S cluster assembly protein SufD [Bacteroidales bacterium]|jgi:Fe-S cluster assembly protein SufD|nr:Fe-S cluster assembly protein SufD [Bacteroidales bacterium]
MTPFTQYIVNLFEKNAKQLTEGDVGFLADLRKKAIAVFAERGFPTGKMESWRHHPLDQHVEKEYTLQLTPEPYLPIDKVFKCKIGNIGTNMFTLMNGWYVHQHAPLTIFPNGMMVGSLLMAIQQHPDLVKAHLAQQDLQKTDPLVAMNESLFTDGLFIYVPDNLHVDQPIQMVSLATSKENLLIQNRNLIVLGKNASLSIIYCNDSIHDGKSFTNNVTEISLDEQAKMNYYKMENKDPDSLLIDHILVDGKTSAQFLSNTITFNAGYVRTMITVNLNEPYADAKLYGLYLVDKMQYVDNHVFVWHKATDCTSTQLYKGVIDNEATANFNGHILVAQDAQRTAAFQTNRNITLTDEARIMTKPFLEIYADDVQCSHGATVGQLNDEALFYLRSRGICERNARILLLYAFANEIVETIEIESLRHRLTDMVKKRIRGEFSHCEECVLHCSDPKDITFSIDVSKI